MNVRVQVKKGKRRGRAISRSYFLFCRPTPTRNAHSGKGDERQGKDKLLILLTLIFLLSPITHHTSLSMKWYTV
ncbi:MAG: hypothetical protein CO090_00110 [Acidobacteria bacterium CG_4_9_14_3_um_filter_49_7]|nr:MAG: hypothetical protein CO090_00110 [Acidobacteria bacterium CG_4_9_14_3_um_filter_49_7]